MAAAVDRPMQVEFFLLPDSEIAGWGNEGGNMICKVEHSPGYLKVGTHKIPRISDPMTLAGWR